MKQLLTLLLLVALPGMASAQVPPAPAAAAPDAVIISGQGVAVHRAEFERALSALPAEYQQYAAGAGKRQFATDYLRMKLLAAAGKEAGLQDDPAVVEELALMRENLVASTQLKRMEAEITVSEADLEKMYETRKAEFEKVQARHILIAYKGSRAASPDKPELTEEQARTKAEALRAKIERGEATFEDVAKAESDDTGSAKEGGSLGDFRRGEMLPEFEDAAFATEAGKLSPVIRTVYGYHLIKVEAHALTPFAEAKPALEAAARTEGLQQRIAQLIDEAKPTLDPSYFGPQP